MCVYDAADGCTGVTQISLGQPTEWNHPHGDGPDDECDVAVSASIPMYV